MEVSVNFFMPEVLLTGMGGGKIEKQFFPGSRSPDVGVSREETG
jgi:hypothetical protein